jgi:hypothetical protein
MAKRGRPPFEHSIALEKMFSHLKAFYPGIKTRRGLQDKYYALNAYGDLHDMEGFELIDKPSILAELGRFKERAVIREIATQVIEKTRQDRNYTVKEWVSLLRGIRLGRF